MSVPSIRFKIASKLAEEEMRVAEVIHVPTMVAACTDCLPDVVLEFFDDIDRGKKQSLRVGGRGFVDFVTKVESLPADDHRSFELAEFLARQREIEFFVRVEWPVREYKRRGTRYPLGTCLSSWGYYSSRWFAGHSIAACVKQARDAATREHQAAWEKAPQEPGK